MNETARRASGALNILGLAIGIACAGVIFLWVEDENGYDQQHLKRDRLYYVRVNQNYDAHISTFSSTPGLLGPAIQADIPGIANTCRMTEGATSPLFSIGERVLYAGGNYVEPSFFSMFTLAFEEGNPKVPFRSYTRWSSPKARR